MEQQIKVSKEDFDRLKAIEETARDFLRCPYSIDMATVPRAGIDAAPGQVVLNVSVAWIYRENLRRLFEEGKLAYAHEKCKCNRIIYFKPEDGYECLCGNSKKGEWWSKSKSK